ncbi:MAG: tRNA (adenosine(37)-N6)-threonylcarbamoyltransferase complex dimerization subunit type 1 TsaB [Alphaproteobacteria bacterium]|nr:tRNA (adenosine(37)-N6)-threonylcarbamoyltransferase complex dimerization subunit type 1 TsaB [Alphaproteobacteria bacterium]
MKVLGLDSALGACSAAVWDQTVIDCQHRIMPRGHVEELIPMTQETVAASGLGFDQLDLIAVSIGPGSFTGLRAGLAAARGFGLALNIPVHGVTTLEAVAFAASRQVPMGPSNPIIVALETKRADIYVQKFDGRGVAQGVPAAQLPLAAAGLLTDKMNLCGDAANRVLAEASEVMQGNINHLADIERPEAGDIAAIAASRVTIPVLAEPLYIHPPVAKIPAAAGRLRP